MISKTNLFISRNRRLHFSALQVVKRCLYRFLFQAAAALHPCQLHGTAALSPGKIYKKAAFYNQTASKAEQIALCQFIRDGHLASQTRKLRRLYSQKLKALSQAVRETFGQDCQIQTGAAGTSLALTLPCSLTGSELTDRARNRGLGLEVLRENGAEVTLVLSCSSIPSKDFLPACQLLKEVTGS